MLTTKEIKKLQPGEYPNGRLRAIFGKKHGSVVPGRFTKKDGTEIDAEFIGNRSQRKFRIKNPLSPLPEQTKPVYQSNRIEAKKKIGLFGKLVRFIGKLFGRSK